MGLAQSIGAIPDASAGTRVDPGVSQRRGVPAALLTPLVGVSLE
jgi:hypothetical protein